MKLKPDGENNSEPESSLRYKSANVRQDSDIVPQVNYAVAYEVSLFSGVVCAVERF